MHIYFNFLNDNILINNDLDNICGDVPEHFVEFIHKYDSSINNNFIKIQHDNKDYYVHISTLKWYC